jgi:hypothetical protein
MDGDEIAATSEGKGSGADGDPDGSPSQGSVFGNLPKTRPGVRSPRRRSGAASERGPASEAKGAPAADVSASPGDPERTPARGARAATRRPAEVPGAADESGGLEDLAWAGVTAAAQAATLGVRIANRALEALREAVERR